MRIFADSHNRRLMRFLAAVLFLFCIAAQFLCGGFSWKMLLLSLTAAAAVLLGCIGYLTRRERVIDEAAQSIRRLLSGEGEKRIACDEEGALFRLFHEINTLSAVLGAKGEREKQTNELLRETVSDISHQLKTPLASLEIYNGLTAGAESMEDVRLFAASSETELDRMNALVKNLLKLARLDAGAVVFEIRPQNMAEIMEDVRQRFSARAERENKRLEFVGAGELFPCDAVWLAEAFGNMVKNALDHTGQGGVIRTEWERSGNIMHVSVSDNGSGIAPEDMAHIFKRFYRSRNSQDQQGAGLGLPLAKKIVEAHGGLLEAESEPGQGSVFRVSFVIPTEM